MASHLLYLTFPLPLFPLADLFVKINRGGFHLNNEASENGQRGDADGAACCPEPSL
jgi:hypothetical protein